MKLILVLVLVLFCLTGFAQTYYIVRHAEKAQPNGDPPLSRDGEARARALKDLLSDKHIKSIFTTNTVRTRATARPLSLAINNTPTIYTSADQAFIQTLKTQRYNTLIVGHSNTIDDIVNGLCNSVEVKADIPDSQYDNLYIITGVNRKVILNATKYGKATK